MYKIDICFEGISSFLNEDAKIKVIRESIDKLIYKN